MVDQEASSHRPPLVYRGMDLSSDTIHTLVLGGGGYFGVLYVGLFQWLEAHQMRNDIKTVIGVSVGSMMGCLFALGYSSQEMIDIITVEMNLPKCLEVNADNILNIIDGLGINKGEYIEQCIKSFISRRGVNPYITIQGLYELTGIDFQVGFTKCVDNRFVLASRHNEYRNMPVWLAIRASCSIPVILDPVVDFENNDILVDGGVISNNPIKYYLAAYWQANSPHPAALHNHSTTHHIQSNHNKQHHKLHTREIGVQCDMSVSAEESGEITIEEVPVDPPTADKAPPTKKYRQGFLSIELNTRPRAQMNIHSGPPYMNIDEYLITIFSKIFTNQESYRDKYSQYVCVFDCLQYNHFLNFASLKNNITVEQLTGMTEKIGQLLDRYLADHLLSSKAEYRRV